MNQFRNLIACVMLAMLAVGCSSSRRGPAAASNRDTNRARELNQRAFKLIEGGKFTDAEKLLKDAIAADPMFGPARNNLGLVYYQTDRLYEAAWEFENATRLMPYQPETRNNLGLVLEKAGKLSNAADAYARAREMEPDNPEFLANLARARIRRGDRDEATRKLLEEVVMKDARPQWNDWARMNLLKLNALDAAERIAPVTQP